MLLYENNNDKQAYCIIAMFSLASLLPLGAQRSKDAHLYGAVKVCGLRKDARAINAIF
jgi:hypothetical protein